MALWKRIKNFFTGTSEEDTINAIREKILRYADRYRNSGNIDSANRCVYFAQKVLECKNLAQARIVEKEFFLFVNENDETVKTHRSAFYNDDSDIDNDTDDGTDFDDDSNDNENFSDNS